MRSFRGKDGFRTAAALATMAVVAVAAGALMRSTLGGDASARATGANTIPAKGAPVALTATQCRAAASMLSQLEKESTLGSLPQHLTQGDLAKLNEDVRQSTAWVSKGCPADAVRGYYPSPGGKGGAIQILTVQSWGGESLDGKSRIDIRPVSP